MQVLTSRQIWTDWLSLVLLLVFLLLDELADLDVDLVSLLQFFVNLGLRER